MELETIVKIAASGLQTPKALTDCFDPVQQAYIPLPVGAYTRNTMDAIGDIAVKELESVYVEMNEYGDREQLADAETALRGLAKHFSDMADALSKARSAAGSSAGFGPKPYHSVPLPMSPKM